MAAVGETAVTVPVGTAMAVAVVSAVAVIAVAAVVGVAIMTTIGVRITVAIPEIGHANRERWAISVRITIRVGVSIRAIRSYRSAVSWSAVSRRGS